MAQKQEVEEKASLDQVTAIFNKITSLETSMTSQTKSLADMQKQFDDLQKLLSIDKLSNKKWMTELINTIPISKEFMTFYILTSPNCYS